MRPQNLTYLALLFGHFLAAATAYGQPPAISGELAVAPYRFVELKVTTPDPKAGYRWVIKADDPRNKAEVRAAPDKKSVLFVGPPGTYTVRLAWAKVVDGVPEFDEQEVTVTIGTPKPPPPPPPPPGPGPDVAPIPAAGLHVLILDETKTRSTLPPAQLSLMFSESVHAFLNANCPLEPGNTRKAWYILDQDENMAGADKKWQDAVKRAKATPGFKTPWLMISNPAIGGYEGPLPANEAEFLALTRKYVGTGGKR